MAGRRYVPYPGLRKGIAFGYAPRTSLARRMARCRRAGGSATQTHLPDAALVRNSEAARIEAVLLAADAPVSPRRLAHLAEISDIRRVRALVHVLNRLYALDASTFRVEELAGGYRLLTRPELQSWLVTVKPANETLQLSRAMVETLAIVAYRQPICRADIEAIRGVQVEEILRQLLEKNMIRLVGRDDSIGRPYLYGTTKRFLEVFGLRDLSELPMAERLRQRERGNGVASDKTAEQVGTNSASDRQKDPEIGAGERRSVRSYAERRNEG